MRAGAGGFLRFSTPRAAPFNFLSFLFFLPSVQCAEPLPLWCFVAGGILLALLLFFLLEVFLGPKLGWHGLLHQCSSTASKHDAEEDEDHREPNRSSPANSASSSSGENLFTLMSIAQVTVLVAFVTAFVYGAYAVLAIFGQQRNAVPGTEVCDKQLYDPLFFIIILFDVLLVVVLLLAVCLNCDALCCNCCGCGETDRKRRDEASRRHQREDDVLVKEAETPLFSAGGGKDDESKPLKADAMPGEPSASSSSLRLRAPGPNDSSAV